jgi:hypothetical protein
MWMGRRAMMLKEECVKLWLQPESQIHFDEDGKTRHVVERRMCQAVASTGVAAYNFITNHVMVGSGPMCIVHRQRKERILLCTVLGALSWFVTDL